MVRSLRWHRTSGPDTLRSFTVRWTVSWALFSPPVPPAPPVSSDPRSLPTVSLILRSAETDKRVTGWMGIYEVLWGNDLTESSHEKTLELNLTLTSAEVWADRFESHQRVTDTYTDGWSSSELLFHKNKLLGLVFSYYFSLMRTIFLTWLMTSDRRSYETNRSVMSCNHVLPLIKAHQTRLYLKCI